MKNWAIIGTWSMALDGVRKAAGLLKQGGIAADAVETAIIMVEDYREYNSVGYGGLPNEVGLVEMDAAFMHGDTFALGAVGAIKDFSNPISIARALSEEKVCNFLVGSGAEEYAGRKGFFRKNMLTDESVEKWRIRCQDSVNLEIKSYDGHDTVCVIALDQHGSMVVGTSTSGLFMKRPGRLGDAPLVGPGFYADSAIGAAAATGLGEDIMKGNLSYEAVRRMAAGLSPTEAAQSSIDDFTAQLLKRNPGYRDLEISLICMNKHGRFGTGTTLEFSCAAATVGMEAAVL